LVLSLSYAFPAVSAPPQTCPLSLHDALPISHWGISEANEDYLRRAHAVCPVTAVQNRYSMMARQYEPLFPVLEELGVGLVAFSRSEEHTSELQSRFDLVCRLLLEKKKNTQRT